MRAFLGGLLTELPLIIVQILLARAAARRWPRFRWLAYAVALLPILLIFLGLANLSVRVPVPGWLYFAEFLWLFTSFAAYVVFWAIRLPGLFRRRSLKKAANSEPSANSVDVRRRDLLKTAAYAGASVPFAVGLYGSFVERLNFAVKEVDIPFPNLHPDLVGLRILQISDIHLSAYLSVADLKRVVEATRELKADIVMHTGDLISSPGDPLQECLDELAKIKSVAGAFGCNGNHEIYAKVVQQAKEEAAKRGIEILRGESRNLQFGQATLRLSGIDYQPFYTRAQYLAGGEFLLEPGVFNVLLSHNPDVFRKAGPMGFDLTLAGHTHGGQVRVEILNQDLNPARVYTPYVSGLYLEGGRACYVTRGIGSVGIPARIGAPPEITLLRLTRA